MSIYASFNPKYTHEFSADGKSFQALIYPTTRTRYGAHVEGYTHLIRLAEKNQTALLIEFITSDSHSKLLKSISNILERVMSAGADENQVAWAYSYNDEVGRLNRYINTIGTDERAAFQFLVKLFGRVSRKGEIEELVDAHLERWGKGENLSKRDAFMYWHPSFGQWDWETFEGLSAIEHSVTGITLKRLADDEFRACFNVLSRVGMNIKPTSSEANMNIQDFAKAATSFTSDGSFLKLPFHQGEFREYLRDLSVSEYLLIKGRIPVSTSGPTAVTMAQSIISSSATKTSVQDGFRSYYSVTKSARFEGEEDQDSVFWSRIHDYHMHNYMYSALTGLAAEYFSEQEEGTVPIKKIEELHRILFRSKDSYFAPSKSLANSIVEDLRNTTGSASVTMRVLEAVSERRVSMSVDDWHRFISRWDDFKDMDTALALPLL